MLILRAFMSTGVQYLTGQYFDIHAITKAAHSKVCKNITSKNKLIITVILYWFRVAM